jgi:hypothetical protein
MEKITYDDGEVVGVDTDGTILCWDAKQEKPYNTGETLAQYGTVDLTDREKFKLGMTHLAESHQTAIMPTCATQPDTLKPDDVAKRLMDLWNDKQITNPAYLLKAMGDHWQNSVLAYGCRLLDCRKEINMRNCEINALRIALSEALSKAKA